MQSGQQSTFMPKAEGLRAGSDEEEEGEEQSLLEKHRAQRAQRSKRELREERRKKEEKEASEKEERLRKVYNRSNQHSFNLNAFHMCMIPKVAVRF